MTSLRITAYAFSIAIVALAGFGVARSVTAPSAELPVPEVKAVYTEPVLNRADYDRRLRMLAHVPEETSAVEPTGDAPTVQDASGDGTAESGASSTDSGVAGAVAEEPSKWPVTDAPYPNVGAILPFHRIVAYYGNFYSTRMGVLGEYDEDVMRAKWEEEIAKWEAADPETPVMPAVDYIAIVAQGAPGKDGMWRARMPDAQIQKAVDLADRVGGIVILEVQAGFSPVMTEVKSLEKWLSLPQVHLAIDPEFAMRRRGEPPGRVVGTVDASEANAAADYLATLVAEHGLPPKILIVHRYTQAMLTNATDITPRKDVQVVIDMDGWGPPAQKFGTYNHYVAPYPVQFTGFKLFYKNDVKTGVPMLTPEQVLGLTPAPIFIQYQ